MSKAFNIDRPTLMIRQLDQRQIDGIRKILADNPEHGSLIPNLKGTVWFDGCGCDFRTKDGTVVSADIKLVSDAGVTRLELVSYTENYSYFHVDSLTDIVGDHVFHYNGEDFTVRVPDPAEQEDEPLEIVERSSGYWVVDDSGPVAGPFLELEEAVTFVELYSPPE